MNWLGNQEGEGFEYHMLAAGIPAALLAKGGGALSVDSLLFGRHARLKAPARNA